MFAKSIWRHDSSNIAVCGLDRWATYLKEFVMNTLAQNGFTLRRPTWDDAEKVTELVCLVDIDEFGKAETSVEDIKAMWRRPHFDLEKDAWMVYAHDGSLAAYTDFYLKDGLVYVNNNSSVHPRFKGQGLREWYLNEAEAWARDSAQRPIVLRHVVNAAEPDKLAMMEQAGYRAVRDAYIMRINLDSPPPVPAMPEGIEFRSFARGQDEHAVWACFQEAFRDMWSHPDVPFDYWISGFGKNPDWSPELSLLAVQGDEIAGAVITLVEPSGGWLQQVAVRRPWRKQGVALALLQTIFGELYRRGVKTAGLEVDAESTTGALRLYEKAGMFVDEHFRQFRKELAPELTVV